MTLLEWTLEHSRSGVTVEQVKETLTQYGPALRYVKEWGKDGQLVAYAVLMPPARLFGKTIVGWLMIGKFPSVNSEYFLDRVKAEARAMGGDTLMGSTNRNPAAIERAYGRYGAKVHSVNIWWDLKIEEDAKVYASERPQPAQSRHRRRKKTHRVHKVSSTSTHHERELPQQ